MIVYENDGDGTVLKIEKEDSAIILSDGQWNVMIPDRADDEMVNRNEALLVAFMLKSTDEKWVDELLEEMEDVYGD